MALDPQQRLMQARPAALAAALLVALVLALALGWRGQAPADEWQAYVEADFVRPGAVLPGRITRLAVARGDRVQPGTLLFAQDDGAERAALAAAEAGLAQAQASLVDAKTAMRETEITASRAARAQAAAVLAQASSDLARINALAGQGAVSRMQRDAAREAVESAKAGLMAAEARLVQANAPVARENAIRAAEAAERAARAQLLDAQWRLAQREIRAGSAGAVSEVFAREGEMLNAGMPAVEILPPQNIRLRFYVRETELGRFHLGTRLKILCDGCTRDLEAQVDFLSPRAEFTPPVIYSNDTRAKLSFLIEAKPLDADLASMHPGQPLRVGLLPP